MSDKGRWRARIERAYSSIVTNSTNELPALSILKLFPQLNDVYITSLK